MTCAKLSEVALHREKLAKCKMYIESYEHEAFPSFVSLCKASKACLMASESLLEPLKGLLKAS